MKQLKKYFNVTVMALLLSTILYSTYSSAVSAEFNKNTRVDSNSWTKMASAKKSTGNHYAAIYLVNILDVYLISNKNYKLLYAIISH